MAEMERTIVQPTVAGLQKDGLPYRGFLYFGLMLTPRGRRSSNTTAASAIPNARP